MYSFGSVFLMNPNLGAYNNNNILQATPRVYQYKSSTGKGNAGLGMVISSRPEYDLDRRIHCYNNIMDSSQRGVRTIDFHATGDIGLFRWRAGKTGFLNITTCSSYSVERDILF